MYENLFKPEDHATINPLNAHCPQCGTLSTFPRPYFQRHVGFKNMIQKKELPCTQCGLDLFDLAHKLQTAEVERLKSNAYLFAGVMITFIIVLKLI